MGNVTKGLVSRVIADLESKGYVKRDKISVNQDRNYKIILDEKGEDFIAKKKTQMPKIPKLLENKLALQDMETFLEVLCILTDIQE